MERFLEGHRREERNKKEEKERMKNSVSEKRDKEGKFVSGGKEEVEVVNDKSGGAVENTADGNVASATTSTAVKTADSQIGAADASSSISMKDVATAEKHPREEENNEDGAATKKQKLDEEGS